MTLSDDKETRLTLVSRLSDMIENHLIIWVHHAKSGDVRIKALDLLLNFKWSTDLLSCFLLGDCDKDLLILSIFADLE